MSKAFNEISTGLGDAIKHAKGKRSQVVVHKPETINVKAIPAKIGMSQQRFCATFGISLGTLRHWEQGLRSPRAAPAGTGCVEMEFYACKALADKGSGMVL